MTKLIPEAELAHFINTCIHIPLPLHDKGLFLLLGIDAYQVILLPSVGWVPLGHRSRTSYIYADVYFK